MSPQLTFEIYNQLITRTDNYQPVAKSQNFLRAAFTFESDWGNADKIAIFQAGRKTYEVILDDNNECTVPWEVLTHSGNFFVSVYSGDRITATKVPVLVLPTGFTDKVDTPQDPSVDVYSALIGRMDSIDERIEETVKEAIGDQIDTKLDAPAIAGASGQVLTSDGNGGQTWEDAAGNADWNAKSDEPGYIENKPGIYSGDALGLRTNYGFAPGAAAIALGTAVASFIVRISGDANATEYTYSSQYAPSLSWYQMAMIETGKVRIRANGVIAYITAMDTTARTITVDSTLSTDALSNQSASILFSTTASGSSSVAIGSNDFSTGLKSFAYGSDNLASGNYSIASGVQTVSSGTQSSTKGKGTIANHKSQDVSGEYNIEDSNTSANTERGTYVEIVGNGTGNDARSNARTLDWNGNEWIKGKFKIGGTSYDDPNAKELATKEYVDEHAGAGSVTDVKINGTSIVDSETGEADIPISSNDNAGVIKSSNAYGIYTSNEYIRIYGASTAETKAGSHSYRPITPNHQHESTFYGLARAAGDTTQSQSSNAVGTYTEEAKSAISEMLGGAVSVTGTTPNINAKAGIRYICGKVLALDITLPSSGIVDVVFTSGSTPTVLTITPPTGQTVKWANGFDPTSLDADTTYEINIMDGLGVAIGWT